MLNPLVLIPAYGKTYRTQEEMQAAWDSGKDFCDWRMTGRYCSVRDIEDLSYMTSSITLIDPRSGVQLSIKPLEKWAHVGKRG